MKIRFIKCGLFLLLIKYTNLSFHIFFKYNKSVKPTISIENPIKKIIVGTKWVRAAHPAAGGSGIGKSASSPSINKRYYLVFL